MIRDWTLSTLETCFTWVSVPHTKRLEWFKTFPEDLICFHCLVRTNRVEEEIMKVTTVSNRIMGYLADASVRDRILSGKPTEGIFFSKLSRGLDILSGYRVSAYDPWLFGCFYRWSLIGCLYSDSNCCHIWYERTNERTDGSSTASKKHHTYLPSPAPILFKSFVLSSSRSYPHLPRKSDAPLNQKNESPR